MVKYSNQDTAIARNHELHDYAEHYINSRTVAGRYRDSMGQLYEFNANGKAVFPDYSFEFSIPFSFFYYIEVAYEKGVDEYFKRNHQYINVFHPLSLKPIKGKQDFKKLGYYWKDGFLYIVKDWKTRSAIKLEPVE
jgi:hypothetical protein